MKIQAYFWDIGIVRPWKRCYTLHVLVSEDNKLFWQEVDSSIYKENLNNNIPILGPCICPFPWDFKYDKIRFYKFLYAHPTISNLNAILMVGQLLMVVATGFLLKLPMRFTRAIHQKSKNLFCSPK